MKWTLLGWVLAGPALLGAAAGTEPAVRVYVPRAAKAPDEHLQLSEICVVLCDDARTEARARAVAMGRAPWPGEKLLIDRRTILCRLATSKIAKARVRFVGAPAVSVTREEVVIRAGKLLAAAEKFLQQSMPAHEPCIYRVVREPDELVVPGRGDLEYSCKLADRAPTARVKVIVRVLREGKQLALREIPYKRMYPIRRAVATRAIPAGAVVTKRNVEIQTSYAERPAPVNWQAPYGRLAARTLLPGTVLGPGLTAEKRPDLVIRRNQIVELRVQGLGLLVTAKGVALQTGRPGDFIKVRNVDTHRVVIGRVAFDGAVEPLFRR